MKRSLTLFSLIAALFLAGIGQPRIGWHRDAELIEICGRPRQVVCVRVSAIPVVVVGEA